MGYVIGLRDLYFAPLNTTGDGWMTPIKIRDAINATITPNFSVTNLYADDRAVAVAQALGSISVSLNVADLKDTEYDTLMGTTKNTEGVIIDNADDVAPYGALLFRLPLDDGGFRFYCYYKGKFQPPGTTSNTKGESVTFETATITGTFVAMDNGDWRARHDSPSTLTTVAQAWFTSVYEPTPAP
ncbi:phage tail protein [Bacillaceae bacterium Marseille-Q3522]|nr:phage tail protein [Bacillaceae bacterium Marseille-Q3522]